MSRLKVNLRGTLISEVVLVKDREYIGGRKESCEIRLQPEKGISREHFKLKFEDSRWKVLSLTRFGEIFSLGQRLESIVLDHGQIFQIPPYEFIFSEITEEEIAVPDVSSAISINETDKTVIGVTQQTPFIKMLSSQGDIREMLRLDFGDIWVAGRDSSCQIIIPDQRVSRRQFEIRKINGIYTVIDMDSVNGTFLNGSVVSTTDPMPIKSGDSITVLDNVMYFELHDPNFQYRIEKIEVPPIEIENDFLQAPIEEVNFDHLGQNQPLTFQSNESQQTNLAHQDLNIPGGPFTGMPLPNDALANSQYYSFQDSTVTPVEAKKNLYQKVKSSPPLLISVILLFLGGSYFLSEFLNKQEVEVIQKPAVAVNTDPFSKLTPEKQKKVQELYEKAQSEMIQSLNEMAKDSLQNLHLILSEGYLDSKQKLAEVLANEQTIVQQKAEEEEAKEKAENEAKIRKITAECEKLINPEITEERIINCMSEAIALNPEHPEIARISAQVKSIIEQQNSKNQDVAKLKEQAYELQKLYDAAEKIRNEGLPYKAISAYEIVKKSDLPDPESLKIKAERKIKLILKAIENQSSISLNAAEEAIKNSQLKAAILALREAQKYDPENVIIKDKIAKYQNEIRLQAMVIFQESIVDESFGYVEGNETRPGAKDKWKKIIELDLDDGEYYRKAYVKLKKYGVY